MNRKRYVIVESEFLNLVDFSQVLQDSDQKVRFNISQTRFILKWEGETPQTVLNLPGYDGPYTQSEMLLVLTATEWQDII